MEYFLKRENAKHYVDHKVIAEFRQALEMYESGEMLFIDLKLRGCCELKLRPAKWAGDDRIE